MGSVGNKYRVHEVAKDFGVPTKQIAEILTKYAETPKNHMQVLGDRELSLIFESLTQHNQVENIESIFADVYHEPKPAQAKPAQPQQSAAKPAAKGESRPQSAAPQADKSGEQPRAQGGKPEQAQARPATRVPEKKVVDTRKGGAVNLEKYDERLESFTDQRQQDRGGKQKFQGRNAQRQRGRQQGPGNKRKQEEQERLRRLQLEIAKKAPVKVLIPVNLRNLFPTRTLRNFASYITPEIDPRTGDYTFSEICAAVHHRMGLENNTHTLRSKFAANVASEKSPVLKVMPLFIKNIAMKAAFNAVGERKSCLCLSNLGAVELPEAMAPYVQRLDFIIGVQAAAPHDCGVVSWNGTMYINCIRSIQEPELELHFYRVLQRLGLPVKVESNRRGRG